VIPLFLFEGCDFWNQSFQNSYYLGTLLALSVSLSVAGQKMNEKTNFSQKYILSLHAEQTLFSGNLKIT